MENMTIGAKMVSLFRNVLRQFIGGESAEEPEHDISKIMDKGKEERERESREWAKQQLDRVAVEMDNKSNEGTNMKALFLKLLDTLGCQYEVEDDGRVNFRFEGGNYLAYPSRYYGFLEVIFPCIYDFGLYDGGQLIKLGHVLSQVNRSFVAQTFYTLNEDEVLVHCRQVFYLAENIPHVEEYLRQYLRIMFDVRRFVSDEMEKGDDID